MTDAGGSTPPRWHPDPGGSGNLRWWDGAVWTEHLTTLPPAPAVTPVPLVVPPALPFPVHTHTVIGPGTPREVLLPGASNLTPQASAYLMGSVGDRAEPVRWNTSWAWLLAAWPIYFFGLSIAGSFFAVQQMTQSGSVSGAELVYLTVGLLELVLLAVVIAAAFRDRSLLRRLGYVRRASPSWILLGPLGYLIARTVRVYGEVRRGLGPLLFTIVSLAVMGAIYAAFSVTAPITR